MSSSESWYARRAAQFYGPIDAQKSRAERVELLREKIAHLELEALFGRAPSSCAGMVKPGLTSRHTR
jgi:hypothetical protein